MDSQDGLNYLGRIIAGCSMRIVARTGGVVVCTLSLHAEGPFGVGARFHIWWCILILNKAEITHLVVDMDLEYG